MDGTEVSSSKDLDEVASSSFENLFISKRVEDTSYLVMSIEKSIDDSIN